MSEQDPETQRAWMVRRSSGEVFAIDALTTLQRWIVEQRVTRHDAISRSGRSWKRLGEIVEFSPFFEVADAASGTVTQPTLDADQGSSAMARSPQGNPQTVRRPAARRNGRGEPLLEPAFAQSQAAFTALGRRAAWENNDDDGGPHHVQKEADRSMRWSPWFAAFFLLAGGALAVAFLQPPWLQAVIADVSVVIHGETSDLRAAIKNDTGADIAATQVAPGEQPPSGKVVPPVEIAPDAVAAHIADTAKDTETNAAIDEPEPPADDPIANEPQSPVSPERVPTTTNEDDPVPAKEAPPRPQATEAEPEPESAAASPPAEATLASAAGAAPVTEESVTSPAPKPTAAYERLVIAGDRARRRGQPVEAIQRFERALKLHPEGVAAISGLAACELDIQRYASAIGGFHRALSLAPGFEAAMIGIAATYKAMGNRRQALDYYRAYLEVHPEGQYRADARRQVAMLSAEIEAPQVDAAPEPAPNDAPQETQEPLPAEDTL